MLPGVHQPAGSVMSASTACAKEPAVDIAGVLAGNVPGSLMHAYGLVPGACRPCWRGTCSADGRKKACACAISCDTRFRV